MEPAKPFEKKSELTKKLSLQPGGAGGTLTKLPPINTAAAASKATEKGVGGLNETKNGAAYQVNKKNKKIKNIFCLEPGCRFSYYLFYDKNAKKGKFLV